MGIRLFYLFVVMLGMLTLSGCGAEPAEKAATPREAQLEKEALTQQQSQLNDPRFAGDAHSLVVHEWIAVFDEMNDLLDTVTDSDSARLVRPELESIIETRLQKVRALADTVNEPGEDQAGNQELIETLERWSGERQRFMDNLSRLNRIEGAGLLNEPLQTVINTMTGQ